MPSFVLASSQHPPPFSHAAMPSSNIFSSIANKISGKGKSSSNQKTNSWASSTSSATRSTRLSRGSTRTVDSSHNGEQISSQQKQSLIDVQEHQHPRINHQHIKRPFHRLVGQVRTTDMLSSRSLILFY